MGYVNAQAEYPCGTKVKLEAKGLFMDVSTYGSSFECPLHGEDCCEEMADAEEGN